MARPPRQNQPGGIYHVFARGNDKRPIYEDDTDRQTYLQILGSVVRHREWHCLAYCLMDNHLHLLVQTPHGDLSAGMQRAHAGYAQWFNRRHARVGHLFQGRYGTALQRSERQVRMTAAYIAKNPVESGLCRRAADWKWGSFATYFAAAAPDWLSADRMLSYFGSDRDSALEEFERRVVREEPEEAALALGVPER